MVLPGWKRRFPLVEARARRWGRLLLSRRGADRNRAEKALIALGRPARPYLYKVFWTGPPEASLRAARALRRIASSPWGPPQRRNMLE